MRSSRVGAGLLSLGLWLVCLPCAAQSLRVDRSAERMRVDGSLREWKGARFTTLGDGNDAMLRFAIASTDQGFYLGAEIADDQLVLKKEPGPGQDALVLSLALPDAEGTPRSSEVWLHPGRAGEQKAMALLRRKQDAKIEVVEGPRERGAGFVLEAFVPFAILDNATLWEQGRGTLRFEDYDKPGQKGPDAVLASAPGDRPSEWPRLALGTGQNDMLGAFLSAKSLSGVEPRFDQRANVAGDATPERVVIVDKYVLVYGPGFKRGESYAYFALPYGIGGGLVQSELADLTGDGRAELSVRVRQRNDLGARELFVVLALEEDSIDPLFSQEVKKEAKGGVIEATLRVDKKSSPPRILVNVGTAQGLDALTYQENPAQDAQPILLPWGAVESRSYSFQGDKFVQVEEKARKQAAPPPSQTVPPVAVPAAIRTAPAEPSAAPADAPMSDLAKSILRAPAIGSFRFDREANVVGGAAKERAFVHEKQVVVTGLDLGPTPTYVAYGPPVQRADDLLALDVADVTGDARGELLVRYRMQGSGTEHELLLVLRAEADASGRRLTPILLAEVARRRGSDAIVNQVDTQAGKLRIAPGKAQGFTRENYPFDNQASPGIERLLLPWLDAPQRYRFDGTRLRAE